MEYNGSEILDEIKKLISYEITTIQFNTWINIIKFIQIDDDHFVVSVPNAFTKDNITNRFKETLEKKLNFLMNSQTYYHFVIIEPSDKNYAFYIKESMHDLIRLEKLQANKSMKSSDYFKINKKYVFDNFVKGKSNEFALAGACAVAENPGKSFNPLFIWGGVGLGKTHLMTAIANEISERQPDLKVVYLTSEKFTTELVESIGKNNTTEFRQKYRNIDVLLIDDIQFIAGKESTQEEFFHTFNELYGQDKQIVISSDKPPKDIKKLEDRMRSRFEWGLISDIIPPDYETRMAILQQKSNQENLDISKEVIEFIAANFKSNIRELEGALIKLGAAANLTGKVINIDFAKKYLSSLIGVKVKEPITVDKIFNVISKVYGIAKEDFYSKNRSKSIAYPRQIAMYICRDLTDLSLPKIADNFQRDHTTIMHGIDRIKKDMAKDEDLKKEIENIIKKIQNN